MNLQNLAELGQTLFEEGGDALFLVDPETERFLDANPFAEKLSGFSHDEIAQMQVPHLFRSTVAQAGQRLQNAFRTTCLFHSQEDFLLRRKAHEAWVPVNLTVTRLHVRPRTMGLITARDISERQEAQEKLRKTQELLAAIVETNPDAITVIDRQGQITFANSAAERIHGMPKCEILKRTYNHATWRVTSLEGKELGPGEYAFEHVLTTGEPVSGWERILHRPDGSQVIVSVNASPLRDAAGAIFGVTASLSDITRRKLAEESQRAMARRIVAVQEEERRNIARELHDEIGQVLTAVRLDLQRLSAGNDPARHQESLTHIDEAIHQVRNLSLDLRPAMLDILGLEAALRWLVDRQTARTGLTPHLATHVAGKRFAPDIETACFRIAQQALTNVVRHAEAKNVWLNLEEQGKQLRLTIRDDGRGFELEEARCRGQRGESFGLLVMRERATLLGGHFEIKSRAGHGTEVEAHLPLV